MSPPSRASGREVQRSDVVVRSNIDLIPWALPIAQLSRGIPFRSDSLASCRPFWRLLGALSGLSLVCLGARGPFLGQSWDSPVGFWGHPGGHRPKKRVVSISPSPLRNPKHRFMDPSWGVHVVGCSWGPSPNGTGQPFSRPLTLRPAWDGSRLPSAGLPDGPRSFGRRPRWLAYNMGNIAQDSLQVGPRCPQDSPKGPQEDPREDPKKQT